MKPIAAIVGRPNVGKSTLFNRITKSKNALVDNFPGVTRDRHYQDTVWNDIEFILTDTGGFVNDDSDIFSSQIRDQVICAIEEADVIILLLDGKEGCSAFDKDIINILRPVTKPVFYVVNKIDGFEQEKNLYEFYSLGIEKIYPVSAEHNYGVRDFMDDMIRMFPQNIIQPPQDMIKVAVIGRPNVGKSSLINHIIGEKRLVVSEIPGTTRDSIDSVCKIGENSYILVDTAGIRRKGKVNKKLEKFSIIKSLKSMERCDVALILIDAAEGITDQDISIAGYAFERGCGCIFILNKWDIVPKEQKSVKTYYDQLKMSAKFLNFAPAITISALTGLRVSKIFKLVEEVYAQYTTRIGTGPLNRIVERALIKNEPSLHKGKRIKFYYAAQTGTKPPTFLFFVNYPEGVHFSYKRFLINQVKEATGLDKTPVKIIFRQRRGKENLNKKRKNKR